MARCQLALLNVQISTLRFTFTVQKYINFSFCDYMNVESAGEWIFTKCKLENPVKKKPNKGYIIYVSGETKSVALRVKILNTSKNKRTQKISLKKKVKNHDISQPN